LRGPIQYNPENNEFVFPVQLTSAATHRIQLAAERSPGASNHREFLSADGAEALPHTWEFRTRELRPQENGQKVAGIEAGSRAALNGPDDIARESARITEAGTAEPLRRLVARVRERRRALKSLVETVRDRSYTTNQPWWFHTLEVERSARFWWQGKAQFRADASRFFFPGVPLLVGGDDRRCWSRIGEQFVTAAADAIAVKNVFFGDPLFAARDLTDEAIIGEMKLEYLGEEQYGDANCYRLRSWTFRPASENSPARFDFHDWLIDAKTLLPVVYEEFSSGAPLRFEFNYERIDEELPAEIFEPPTDTGIEPVDPEPLGEGFDKYFLNAMDGSAGRISVRWGKTGKRGTHSSGLN
jgi:hypothetical protein